MISARGSEWKGRIDKAAYSEPTRLHLYVSDNLLEGASFKMDPGEA